VTNLAGVTSPDAEARQQMLDALAAAADDLAFALAALGAAYDELDDFAADRLEEDLFRPVQGAYGRARRTHAEFAARRGLPPHTFEPGSPGVRSVGVRGRIDAAVDAVREADARLAELQDSMMPVEYGDAELRAGLAETRELLGDLPGRARELVRTLGR
jgi:hypothetical protein